MTKGNKLTARLTAMLMAVLLTLSALPVTAAAENDTAVASTLILPLILPFAATVNDPAPFSEPP